MKLHQLIINNGGATSMSKIASDQVPGIMKRAGEIITGRAQAVSFAEEISKIAAAEIEKMDFSDPELNKVASELLSYGAGLADGEALTKQAMAPAIYEEAYNVFISKIAEVMGEEAAEEVDGALREAGGPEQEAADEIDAVKGEIAEMVAAELVDNAGGLEAVTQDPELSADIAGEATETADQIVEEQLAGN